MSVLWTECLCASKILCWNPDNLMVSGEWGLWEVIASRGGHGIEPLWWDFTGGEGMGAIPILWGFCNQGAVSSEPISTGILISDPQLPEQWTVSVYNLSPSVCGVLIPQPSWLRQSANVRVDFPIIYLRYFIKTYSNSLRKFVLLYSFYRWSRHLSNLILAKVKHTAVCQGWLNQQKTGLSYIFIIELY